MEKIQVMRPSIPSYQEYIDEIKPIWDTYWLTNMGSFHQKLQNLLTDYLQTDHLSLFSNGHLALELTLQAMNLSGEVITTPFTFASTTHAIVRNNLTPVFCDIDPKSYTIDADKIESLITDRTTAIVPVHVYGNICDVEKIDKIARKYGLKVIYDAAHAFGVTYKGKGIGTYGDASMFSFHATKVYNTIEGGAVCFQKPELDKLLSQLKNFGILNEDIVDGIGSNAKMNEFQAAMGICNLRHIKEEIEKRKRVIERYIEKLQDVPGLILTTSNQDIEPNYAYFPVVVQEKEFGFTRNEIYDELRKHNIYIRKYFYPLTNTYDCFHGKYDVNKTPIALHISKRVMTLPVYADMTNEQVDYVCVKIINLRQ